MAHHGYCPMATTSRKGGGGICSTSMHRGNYEPEATLVELGVGRERARRKGAMVTRELLWQNCLS